MLEFQAFNFFNRVILKLRKIRWR